MDSTESIDSMADNNNQGAAGAVAPVPAVAVNNPPDVNNAAPQGAAGAGAGNPDLAAFIARLPNDLVTLLAEINGQDTYDASQAALGRLSTNHYLKLPIGFNPEVVSADNIGQRGCVTNMNDLHWAQTYYLNKDVFDTPDSQVKGALLRAELVKAGWVEGTYEVTWVAAPDEADVTAALTNDAAQIQAHMAEAKQLAFLLPLAAEHVFRTMGHHYLTALDRQYIEKYTRFFSACVLAELTNFLPPANLFHLVAHWVPLRKALAVAKSRAQVAKLPNAVVIRANAGPAGTAILTSSEAILGALEQAGLKQTLEKASGVELKLINDMSSTVKARPDKYHTIPSAYDQPVLTEAEKDALEKAKAEAIKLAPVLQGFLDSLPRNSDLPQVRALQKHADHNPLLCKRAKIFFREVGTTKASTMAELFSMDRRGVDAVGGTDIIEDED